MSDEEETAFDSSNDFLKFKNNPEIKKIIDKEQLLFSDKIYKKNSYGLTRRDNLQKELARLLNQDYIHI